MPQDPFQRVCDRLSHNVDATQFERMRWARDEGPKLARLVELLNGVVEAREDIEIVEEGNTPTTKGFVIKVHSQRVVGISVGFENDRAMVAASPLERSNFTVTQGPPVSDEYENVDEPWMQRAVAEMIGRIAPVA